MTLEQRVIEYVQAHPGSTGFEIAVGVKARLADVRQVLNGETFLASPRAAYQSDRAVVYHIAPVAPDGPGRPARPLPDALAALSGKPNPSQCDRILELLADGRPWSSRELHRRVFCVLHSRIAELRRRLRPYGYAIEHSGGGAGTETHWYQLIQVGTSEEVAVRPTAAASSDAPATDSLPSESDPCPRQVGVSEPEQLTMEAA